MILVACHSKKASNKITANHNFSDSLLLNQSVEKLIGPTLKDWTYFSTKTDVQYTNGSKEMKVNAHIRMYKDSLIWISAGIVGFEGVRILISKDSAVVMNKLEKKYMVFSKDSLSKLMHIPVQVNELQHLIISEPIYALKLYAVFLNDSSSFRLKYSSSKLDIHHDYQREKVYIDSTKVIDNFSKNYATITYSEYGDYEGHKFPVKTDIYIQNGKDAITINLKHGNIDFSTALTFPFNIPSSYEKY
jgi:hypothetical protein